MSHGKAKKVERVYSVLACFRYASECVRIL